MSYPCGPENDGPGNTSPELDAFLEWLDEQGLTLEWDDTPLAWMEVDGVPLTQREWRITDLPEFTDVLHRQAITTREAIERAAWDDTKAEERRAGEQAWRDRMTGDVMP